MKTGMASTSHMFDHLDLQKMMQSPANDRLESFNSQRDKEVRSVSHKAKTLYESVGASQRLRCSLRKIP